MDLNLIEKFKKDGKISFLDYLTSNKNVGKDCAFSGGCSSRSEKHKSNENFGIIIAEGLSEYGKELGEPVMIAINFDNCTNNIFQGIRIGHETITDREMILLAGALHFIGYTKFIMQILQNFAINSKVEINSEVQRPLIYQPDYHLEEFIKLFSIKKPTTLSKSNFNSSLELYKLYSSFCQKKGYF